MGKKKIQFPAIALFFVLLLLIIALITQTFSFSPSKSMPPAKIKPTSMPNIPIPAYAPQIFGKQVRVPILLYHYIGNNPDPKDSARDNISMGPDKFNEQMKYLSDNGYNTISLDTLYPTLSGTSTFPSKPVILTFDDGYMDFYYNAYPILKQYNLRATVFIPTALMNQGYYLTWDQIREMSVSGLITFGAHSVHHSNLPTLTADALKLELNGSKKVLQEILGIPVNFMAYPYGTVNSFVIKEVKTAGYLGAVGTWQSKIQSEGTMFNMPRLKVGGGMDLNQFIDLL
ncbi:hypothetical protein A2617_02845 [Candidatus Daviesbacteria bacterium RIFOXYD1_FULL_41_10]|uniref:NodB homology domain-containing protein n=1 Tax=Candidatus Daviesbacteria bacterium RIFOXYD1_FULL_41_10 TaxID=1797801 RepID=A0A1F5N370_9BACT|nr:MAG: hypothetical protein A2617_02845 [Candidatus Daviesbacteria bacterium RIFOXYD1_FULL_41_10]